MKQPQNNPSPEPRRDLATIGSSISIKGDLSGEEDLVIQGKIDGQIHLNKHNVTVGKAGRVKADIYGRSIRVEGEVRGNLYGEEEIVIRASGRVQGNLVAPRVTLENGSQFKGSIDMEPSGKSTPSTAPKVDTKARPQAATPPNPATATKATGTAAAGG